MGEAGAKYCYFYKWTIETRESKANDRLKLSVFVMVVLVNNTTCEFCCVGNLNTSDNARIYGQVESVFGVIRNVYCIYEFMREK